MAFNRQDVFNTRLTYPLAMDKKLAQGDAFRTANEKLRRQLQEIDDFYSRPEAPHHTGDRACQRCKENKEKNDKLLQAIAGYYLFDEPEAWTSDFPGYRDSLHAALNKPDVDWNLIHKAFESGIRQHLRNDLCAVQPSDRPTSISSKQIMSAMYSDGTPLPKILKFYISELESRAPTEATAKMIRTLQSTRTAEERARLYIEYYCSSDPSDPPILRNFKQKYARMFEALVPHDEVLKAMRKEVDEVQKSKAEKLQSQLSELQMAQNAHLKNKQKKLDRNGRGHGNAQQMVDCMMEGCVNEVNLMTDEIIECFICEWLAGKGGQNGEGRQRAIYCSAEHAEQDFVCQSPSDTLKMELIYIYMYRKHTILSLTDVSWETNAYTTQPLEHPTLPPRGYVTTVCLTVSYPTSVPQSVTITILTSIEMTSCRGTLGSTMMMMRWRPSRLRKIWRSWSWRNTRRNEQSIPLANMMIMIRRS